MGPTTHENSKDVRYLRILVYSFPSSMRQVRPAHVHVLGCTPHLSYSSALLGHFVSRSEWPSVRVCSVLQVKYHFTNSNLGQSQYAAASIVPLIKSPSLRVPPPVCPKPLSLATAFFNVSQVELPPDIHPLPDSVAPYVR
jgi:hypothetical protein